MENSISTGKKEFASTHPIIAREEDNDDRVNSERGIDE